MGIIKHNSALVDAMAAEFVRKPERFGCCVRRTAVLSVPDDTWTAVPFNTSAAWPGVYDWALRHTSAWPTPYRFWAAGTPTVLKVPNPADGQLGRLNGEYMAFGNVIFGRPGVTAGIAAIAIQITRVGPVTNYISRQTVPMHTWNRGGVVTGPALTIARKIWLQPDDELQLHLYQSSGGAVDALSLTDESMYFGLNLMR